MSKYKELLHELERYARSANRVDSLMVHISSRLHGEMPRYNWVGFYLAQASAPGTLVLGPYVGSFVPLEKIAFGEGLCGTAAATRKTVVVNDVSADLRYISRAEMVKSEMVVPVVVNHELVAEIDVESYFSGTFSAEDQEFVEACAALVGRFIETHESLPAAVAAHPR
jgi:GAF domain-containing protein